MRWLLAPLSLPYALAMALRNRRYDRTPGASHAAGVPVISVGNITVGGAGKTPLVIVLVRMLLDRGRHPAILTRGYGGTETRAADEVLEFHDALPDTPVVVQPDRVAGARIAREQHNADCLVLDDGFQHRRLRRDLDIVVIDALSPWGGRWVLPAGRLREPLSGLARANLFVITRANQVGSDALDGIEDTLRKFHADPPIAYADVEPLRIVHGGDQFEKVEELAYRSVLPVCGVGNPATFLQLVHELAGRVCPPMVFGDHHRYSARDAAHIAARAKRLGADMVLVTRKDWVKLATHWPPADADGVDLARLDVQLRLRDEDDVIADALDRVLPS